MVDFLLINLGWTRRLVKSESVSTVLQLWNSRLSELSRRIDFSKPLSVSILSVAHILVQVSIYFRPRLYFLFSFPGSVLIVDSLDISNNSRHTRRRIWQESITALLLTSHKCAIPKSQQMEFSESQGSQWPPYLLKFQGTPAERHVENLKVSNLCFTISLLF